MVGLREIRLLLYSMLRDMHGSRELPVEASDGATVRDALMEALNRSDGLRKAVAMIGFERILVVDSKGRRVEFDSPIEDSLYHVMPPPEGGSATPTIKTGILGKGQRVDLNELVSEAAESSKSLGAIALFIGIVREENFSREVVSLIYEDAGKLSEEKLREIVERVAGKHGLSYAAAYHYTGDLRPGDTTMVIVLGGRGRQEVFPALSEIVDEIKANLPIWKKEVYVDGSYSYILGGKPYYPVKDPRITEI